MPFYDIHSNLENFEIASSNPEPQREFGVFAKGYARAAEALAAILLDKDNGFRQYEAYPVFFLYRHSLELYLKHIVIEAYKLGKAQQQRNLPEFAANHNLEKQADLVIKALGILFANETELQNFLNNTLRITAKELSDLDPDSFNYRYPTAKDLTAPKFRTQLTNVNLRDLAVHMEEVFEHLEAISFGIDISEQQQQELLQILATYPWP